MSVHTPGPWIIVNEDYGQIIRGAETEREDRGTKYKFRDFVASTWGERSEINDVNARLIAAAPELLEALNTMTNRYCSLVNSGDAGNWNPEEDPEVQQARAVIAKATGEA